MSSCDSASLSPDKPKAPLTQPLRLNFDGSPANSILSFNFMSFITFSESDLDFKISNWVKKYSF